MRNLILRWLFGTDDIQSYMELLRENIIHCDDDIKHCNECIDLIEAHKKTLQMVKEDINIMRKLVKICENHGIDVDEAIKHLE